jgi:hypothetical protein
MTDKGNCSCETPDSHTFECMSRAQGHLLNWKLTLFLTSREGLRWWEPGKKLNYCSGDGFGTGEEHGGSSIES